MEIDEITVKSEVHRYEVTYQHRAYVVEYRTSKDGGSLYVFDGHQLIYDPAAGGRCLKRGEEIAQAFHRYRQRERQKNYDSWLR